MTHPDHIAAHRASRPGPTRGSQPAGPQIHRDLRGDEIRAAAPDLLPRDPPSVEDIDEQIRSFFDRGLV